MVSKNASVATRITIEQGYIIEAAMEVEAISESVLVRNALEEYIQRHHPDMKWNGA